ncbi:MAG: flippase-like domain-containing protein [Anaerolineae bacterium]|nr:flippase-like domain-containing protein [Anaerolineae bacterium]
MTSKQRLLVFIGIGISAVFLFLSVRGLNFQAVLDAIRSADILLLIFAAFWYLLAIVVIAWRWQFLLRSLKRVPLWPLTKLTCVGYMGNNIYPLRAGEILRIALLRRDQEVPIAPATVVTLTERIFDGVVMVTFVVISLNMLQLPDPTLQSMANAAAPLFAIALVIFFTAAAKPLWFHKLLEVVASILPAKIKGIVMKLGDEVLAGLEGLRTPKDLLGAVITSYGTWLLAAVGYWIVAFAMHIDVGFPLMILAVGVVNLAGLIPASPGQLGVFEFFVVTVMTAAGVADDQALAYAFVLHVIVWLPATLAGFYFLTRMGLNLKAVRSAQSLDTDNENKVVTG